MECTFGKLIASGEGQVEDIDFVIRASDTVLTIFLYFEYLFCYQGSLDFSKAYKGGLVFSGFSTMYSKYP